jgi:hypothetical protein
MEPLCANAEGGIVLVELHSHVLGALGCLCGDQGVQTGDHRGSNGVQLSVWGMKEGP